MIGYIIAGIIITAGVAKLFHKVFIEPKKWQKNYAEGLYGERRRVYYNAGLANSEK